jgi:2-polyprenyl-3-methyl-5-hydroxy-6-metoxy-1,4-benzoquinol methylase
MKSDPSNEKSASARARAKRAKLFGYALEHISQSSNSTAGGLEILDIGGTLQFWRMNARYLPSHLIDSIDVVNLPPTQENEEEISNIKLISYAGNALDKNTLRRDSYDVVHSNSLIEHVGNLADQKLFADNVVSLADHFFIQTPCRTFPIEPHFYFPYFAFLPLSVRSTLHRYKHLGFMGKEQDWLQSRINCEETRLLTKKELISIFPESNCLSERMFLLVKSWMITNMVN